ncbi:hypothetical protein [Neobacillus sp. D3-1R]|uniref:hypothetical protein n=1 Tax=Neobacillus sp. D3-1R TaxID=3445778 RepID=UPI003FA16850
MEHGDGSLASFIGGWGDEAEEPSLCFNTAEAKEPPLCFSKKPEVPLWLLLMILISLQLLE